MVEEGITCPSLDDYAHLRDADPRHHGAYNDAFYRHRARLRRDDREAWLSAHKPFPEVLDAIRRLDGRVPLYACTMKDYETTHELATALGIRSCLQALMTQALGKTKDLLLDAIVAHAGVTHGDIVFVDDLLKYLLPARRQGVRCMLAAWGSGRTDEAQRAAAHGIPVARLDTFPAVVGDQLGIGPV